MTTYSFVSTELARPKSKEVVKYDLSIRQQPEQAKVCTAKERDRRPVDPPPIIQLKVLSEDGQMPNYLQNPYLFMCATLIHGKDDTALPQPNSSTLAGTTVSSLYRLKDADNSEGGFFIFADASAKLEGTFRLKFSLFELAPPDGVLLPGSQQVSHIVSICSQPFTVFSSKAFPGMLPSTFLSRSFSDQGVRIRIRKENRIQMTMYDNDATTSTSRAVPSDRRADALSATQQPARTNNTQFVDDYRNDSQRYTEPVPPAGSYTNRTARRSSQSFHPYNYQPVSPSLLQSQQFQEPARSGPRHGLWRSPEYDNPARSCISPRHSPVSLPRIEPHNYLSQSIPGSHNPYSDYQSGSSSGSSRRFSENSNKSMVLPSPPEHRFADHQIRAQKDYPGTSTGASSFNPYESSAHQNPYGPQQSSQHSVPSEKYNQSGLSSFMRPRVVDHSGQRGDELQRLYKAEAHGKHNTDFQSSDKMLHGMTVPGLPGLSRPAEISGNALDQQVHLSPSTLQTAHGDLRLPPIQSYGEDRVSVATTRQPFYAYDGGHTHQPYHY